MAFVARIETAERILLCVSRNAFVADLHVQYKYGPKIVFETLESYTYKLVLGACLSRRVRPVVAVVVLCPSVATSVPSLSPVLCPSVPSCPSHCHRCCPRSVCPVVRPVPSSSILCHSIPSPVPSSSVRPPSIRPVLPLSSSVLSIVKMSETQTMTRSKL